MLYYKGDYNCNIMHLDTVKNAEFRQTLHLSYVQDEYEEKIVNRRFEFNQKFMPP